jgi:hypothetical protein
MKHWTSASAIFQKTERLLHQPGMIQKSKICKNILDQTGKIKYLLYYE